MGEGQSGAYQMFIDIDDGFALVDPADRKLALVGVAAPELADYLVALQKSRQSFAGPGAAIEAAVLAVDAGLAEFGRVDPAKANLALANCNCIAVDDLSCP